MTRRALTRRRFPDRPWLDDLPSGIRCFPVLVTEAHEKKPLVKWRTRRISCRDGWWWPHFPRANAVGVPGGLATGLVFIDFDEHKPDFMGAGWLEGLELPPTREHRTARGGRHLIFRLPAGMLDLPSRQSVVPGVDVRGEGGYAVWAGVGYRVLEDRPIALLPMGVAELLRASRDTAGAPREAAAWSPAALEDPAVLDVVEAVLAHIEARPDTPIGKLWLRGEKASGDTSASGCQQSMAAMLLARGVPPAVAELMLLELFPWGQAQSAARSMTEEQVHRSVRRSVEGALAFHKARRAAVIAHAFG